MPRVTLSSCSKSNGDRTYQSNALHPNELGLGRAISRNTAEIDVPDRGLGNILVSRVKYKVWSSVRTLEDTEGFDQMCLTFPERVGETLSYWYMQILLKFVHRATL